MEGTTPASGEPNRRRTYVLVLLIEAAVVAALWGFGRYFGA
jgi:hypothetical protein